jgi:hypothetical protein
MVTEETTSLRRFLASTTGWAMIFCLLGAAAIFLPWAEARQYRGQFDADGVFHTKGHGFPETIYATRLWHGYSTTFLFVGLFLFLFVTRRINGVPLWQSLVLLAVAVGTLALLLVGREYNHAAFASDESAGKLVDHSWTAGSCVPVAAALALVLVACIEMRSKVIRPRHGPDTSLAG